MKNVEVRLAVHGGGVASIALPVRIALRVRLAWMWWSAFFTFGVSLGCAASPQASVDLALEVVGTSTSEVVLRDGARMQLDRAELAFGPLTLCPGAQAGSLCETARLEWLDAARVDALSAEPRVVGSLVGATGSVRSFMYDLGVASLLGEPGSRWLSDAARGLGPASLWISGRVEQQGRTLPFSARILVQSEEDNEQGVPVVRKSSTDRFSFEITEQTRALRITFDPAAWVTALRGSDFVQDEPCSLPQTRVCQGSWELSCGASGKEAARQDCAASGQVCSPSVGCAPEVEISKASSAYRTIANALTAGERPTFELR